MTVSYHFIATPNKDRDRSGIGTVLNNEHLIPRCSKCDLANNASLAQFFCCEIFEPGDDAAVCCDGDEL